MTLNRSARRTVAKAARNAPALSTRTYPGDDHDTAVARLRELLAADMSEVAVARCGAVDTELRRRVHEARLEGKHVTVAEAIHAEVRALRASGRVLEARDLVTFYRTMGV